MSGVARLAWATDLHFDHAGPAAREAFLAALAACDADVLAIAGDTGTALSAAALLEALAGAFGRPVCCVLGNHDFYGGSVAGARERLREAAARTPNLTYLWDADLVPLSERSALLGVDGWGDARYGDWAGTTVLLNDFLLIEELARSRPRERLIERLRALGDESADRLRPRLEAAAARYRKLFVVTHVPPFAESAWYQGRRSVAGWVPFFACKATGDVLLATAERYPACSLTVLCGHTHGGGEVQVRENLRVITGAAEYGAPRLQGELVG